MNVHEDWAAVYASNDANGEQDATAVRNRLLKEGLSAEVHLREEPGRDDSYQVRVPLAHREAAAAILSSFNIRDESQVDLSHDLDMITVERTNGTTGEMEAQGIASILDANGISAMIVGSSALPSVGFEVRVAESELERAQTAIAEAKAAGPAAAAEGAAQSEFLP